MLRLALPTAVLLAPLGAALARGPSAGEGSGVVAIQAGTIHLVEDGRVLRDGATLLVEDGIVRAAGSSVEIPPHARVVDYGPDAVIIPGLVAANSGYGSPTASPRTADTGVRAVDNFDFFSSGYLVDLAGGVTSAYVAPARRRLIAGQGAVVKLAGESPQRRVLSESAAIHGAISAEARNAPGYWEPPVPATVDVGMGVEQKQLPRTTMGAILALRELLEIARGGEDDGEYGPRAAAGLRAMMEAGLPWRLGAITETEIRALVRVARSEKLPLVIEGGRDAGALAAELKEIGASVVVEVDFVPNAGGRDRGKAAGAVWPSHDTAAALAAAGVPFALATSDPVRTRDLRFCAGVASRGGLDPETALRSITLDAAVILGVGDRVGSLAEGKHADFAVLNGPPMSATSSVLATWVDGEVAWKSPSNEAVVLEVGELYLGDGSVLRPGQLLMREGRIIEVGQQVAHPIGAAVVRAPAAMPGMIDALGHLGLEGSSKLPSTNFPLKRIVEPGDRVDRRVARAGVTTVVLSPRGSSRTGAPVMAYKPAGCELEEMVIADPAALRLKWTERNRFDSGKSVSDLLKKVVEYDKKWKDYKAAMAEWTPPPPEPVEEKEEEKEEEKADEKKEEDEKDDKSKKKEEEEEDADPLTGVWEGDCPRLQLLLDGEKVSGSLRCPTQSHELVGVEGSYVDGALELCGIGDSGWVRISAKLEKKKGLVGEISSGGEAFPFEAQRTAKEYPRADRPERRRPPKVEKPKPPKGMPKEPGINDKLEPLRRAMRGEGAVVVEVDREDEILECVAAFEGAGIAPVLFGAAEAWRVADEIRGRVSGVLLSHTVLTHSAREGLQSLRNRYAQLADAGIRVAFHSAAEEGASELHLMAAYAVSQGMSPEGALRALTGDAAALMAICDRVGTLRAGLDADVILLDGPPLAPGTSVLRVWVNGEEVR